METGMNTSQRSYTIYNSTLTVPLGAYTIPNNTNSMMIDILKAVINT